MMRYIIATAFILTLLGTTAGYAQEISQTDSLQEQATVSAEPFDVEAAKQNYIDSLTPEQQAKSDAYFEGGYWLTLWNLLYGLAVAWLFMSKGISQKLKQIVSKVKNVNLQNFIYVAMYFVVAYVLSFPMTYYQGFFREHQYDLSNLSFGGWIGEEMTGLILGTVIGGLLVMGLYSAMRKLKDSWWKWAGGLSFIVLFILLFVGPVFISPLFNTYTSLSDESIKEQILSMARANSVPVDNVYQFDASKQSDRISANVSGVGSTIRISLNDNLLNRCTPEEVKAVMGHELGHYVLNHVYEGLVYFTLIIFIGFAFVNWSFQKVLKKWGDLWPAKDISDIAGFPVFVALFSVYFFFAQPVINSIVRTNEMEADVFGLNAAGEPDGFASVAMKLSEYRKINPGYWEEILLFDHPSGHTRVHTSMKWKAEHLSDQK
ncbi:MAG: M48 family metalloprotease [Cyclobacteriaceae bacterium]